MAEEKLSAADSPVQTAESVSVKSDSLKHEIERETDHDATPAPPPPPTALSQGAAATTEAYQSEHEKRVARGEHKVAFKWSSLWKEEEVNPLNQKSYTLPLLRIWSPYSIAFWMATLGFFVAFLSWFAFSPLMPETIKSEFNLTPAQIGNSNIAALSATLIVRAIAGPFVDRYGPRKVMAALLIIGAIPSGLAGTAHDAGSLYTIRFFIGILGATFVPCQAWTTAWFDKSIVGSANALAGGWGNMGGGVTFATQTSLFQRLLADGLPSRVAWRICFVIVPVPILLIVAATMLLFAKDHPLGAWSRRHETAAAEVAALRAEDHQELPATDVEKTVEAKTAGTLLDAKDLKEVKEVDVAVNERPTSSSLVAVLADKRTWMLGLAYATTFGYELALDASLANSLYALFKSPTFHELDAGYIASTYGLLNLFARFLGGLGADIGYAKFGIQFKKWWLLGLAFAQGLVSIGLGMLIDHGSLTLPKYMGLVVMLALTGFAGNGATYALVPHIAPRNTGVICGIVGACGNFGGILYALIFRFAVQSAGKSFWIAGVFCAGLNLFLMAIPLGDAA